MAKTSAFDLRVARLADEKPEHVPHVAAIERGERLGIVRDVPQQGLVGVAGTATHLHRTSKHHPTL